jgi:hypothetical protein
VRIITAFTWVLLASCGTDPATETDGPEAPASVNTGNAPSSGLGPPSAVPDAPEPESTTPEAETPIPPPGYTPSNAPMTEAEFASAFGQALCSTYARCGCTTFGSVNAQSEQECVGQANELGEFRFYLGNPRGWDVLFNGEVARQCLNDIASWHCDAAGTFTFCEGIWEPQREIGEECSSPIECKPSEAGNVGCGSTCTLFEPDTVGTRCTGTCVRGTGKSRCVFNDLSMQPCYLDEGLTCLEGSCAAALPVGAPCSGELECSIDGACSVDGTCVDRAEVGEPCEPAFENSCVAGARCASGVCEPGLALGESCSFDGDCAQEHCNEDTFICDLGNDDVCEF